MSRPRHLATLACVGILASSSLWGTASTARAVETCSGLSTSLLELSGNNGTSLATTSAAESASAQTLGFQLQGPIGRVALVAGSDTVPVHRFYRDGDFVTAPEADVASWVARGYTDQGVRFHAAPVQATCGVAVHRVRQGDVHHDVLDSQVAAWKARGWTDIGAKYRINTVPAAPVTPVTVAGDGDGRFSIAAVPDTQNEAMEAGAPRMVKRNQAILAQRAAQDTRAVIQVGDLVNWDTPTHDQYEKARLGQKVLEDAGLPWVGAIGNHDAQATDVGGSARQGVNVHDALRDTHVYNQYFDASHFRLRAGTFDGTEDNSYHLFEAEGTKWMVLALEVWPRADRLEWARKVVAANPDRNVIIVTHDYLHGDGSVVGDNGGYGDLKVTAIRDQLVAPFANVKVVLSGHEGFDASRVEDFAGHRVVALLNNYDEGNHYDAYLRMLGIDVNADTLTYSYKTYDGSKVPQAETVVGGMQWIR